MNKTQEEKDLRELRNIHVPFWIVRVTEYLVLTLALGCASSFIVLFVWVILLNASAVKIKENQDNNRAILENNQKVILDKIDKNTYRIEQAVKQDTLSKQP